MSEYSASPRVWVIVTPWGVQWCGIVDDETAAWATALGWPSDDEIGERKAVGWYAVPATLSWEALK